MCGQYIQKSGTQELSVVKITESRNWGVYESAWKKCMKDYYWYKEDPVFDWNKHEELEEMESEFKKAGRVFLEAHEDDTIVGVLGLRYRGKDASLRRWEPAALKSSRSKQVWKALLTNALSHISAKGVERVRVTMKYPVNNEVVAHPLLELYEKSGFERYQPDSIDLVARLDHLPEPTPIRASIRIDTQHGTIPEKFGEYCIRAYASTPEDREIHGFDANVTDYGTAVEVLRSILGGGFGPSPIELWKVALVDNEPAGFVGAFIRESKHKPLTGILGPLGVFPEYRRLGIGAYLVSELFNSMKNHGCEYAAVGTPAANKNAIAMYEKTGYKLSSHLVHLEKTL